MNLGYTKRWRKRWEKGYHKDRLLWVMMSYFIDHANYKDSNVYFPNAGKIPLKRGQHIFGTPQLADFFGANRGRIRRKLKILKDVGFLTIKTTNKYSIATVVNYDVYQSTEPENDQQNSPRQTSSRPSNDHQTTTPKEYKKVKKERKKKSEGFALPSKEILTEASIKKINADINTACEKLYKDGIFPKVHAFKNKMLKKNQNERAILHTLTRCYLAKNRLNGDAWGYCMKIMKVENGNYNESDHNKTA